MTQTCLIHVYHYTLINSLIRNLQRATAKKVPNCEEGKKIKTYTKKLSKKTENVLWFYWTGFAVYIYSMPYVKLVAHLAGGRIQPLSKKSSVIVQAVSPKMPQKDLPRKYLK